MQVTNMHLFLVLPMWPETVLSSFCVITLDSHNNSTEVTPNINLYFTGEKTKACKG